MCVCELKNKKYDGLDKLRQVSKNIFINITYLTVAEMCYSQLRHKTAMMSNSYHSQFMVNTAKFFFFFNFSIFSLM